jgi:phenylacetate-CoA ligase
MLRKALQYFWQLERQQWLSPDQLSEISYRRLQRLVNHAYKRVSYYRRCFDESGVCPEHIASVEDLQRIPVLTKRVLQQASPSDFLAEGFDPKKCISRKTSGSTGQPLTVRRTMDELVYGHLAYVRACVANGRRLWHRQAIIDDRARIPKGENWIDWIRRARKVYLWSGQDVHEQIQILRSYRPNVIRGYSQSLKLLAHALKQSGITDLTPRLVFGFAEFLDGPSRALINEVFAVDMIDLYATRETDWIAWECPEHCGYHVNSDTLIVEFIRNGRPAKAGEPGRIVITPLHLYAMPLIRYDTGDVGTPTDRRCSCGRGLPLMEAIQGRMDQFVTLPSGTLVPPTGTFAMIIEEEPSVVEYLVVQQDYDLIVVKLVMREENSSIGVVERVRQRIGDLVRHEAVVKVEVVRRIDRGPEAKLRRIVSKVPVNF